MDPVGEIRDRGDLRVESRAVAQLQEAAEPAVVRQEGEFLVTQLFGDGEHLLGVLQALVDHLRIAACPMLGVQGCHERLGVPQSPRHLDRLGADGEPPLALV